MTAYKGNKKLAYETDATGAVGLGDASIFQSYMVCSEYSPTRTRLSFSKVAAGAWNIIHTGSHFLSINVSETNQLLILVKFTNHVKNLDETVKEGAEINIFLQIDDEEDNIQPSFYSFGTGERDVQVRYMFICRREMTQRLLHLF